MGGSWWHPWPLGEVQCTSVACDPAGQRMPPSPRAGPCGGGCGVVHAFGVAGVATSMHGVCLRWLLSWRRYGACFKAWLVMDSAGGGVWMVL
jgi:hypothetical protein